MPRLVIALGMLTQIGVRPVVLYGLYRLGLVTGYFRRMDRHLLVTARRAGDSLFPVLEPPDAATLKAQVGRSSLSKLRRIADAAAQGRVRIFGGRYSPLKLAGGRPLRHWTAYERSAEARQEFSRPHGDIKFPWEHARFAWAYALGRAFHIFGREQYARAFWRHFARFDRANPPYRGGNWANGQEVAIRLLALLWCAGVFRGARSSTPSRLARLTRSIAEHAARIPPTLMYARSQNNNHLVTEAAALYVAGAAFDHKGWRELGWRWLNRALPRQIGPQGEYIQLSTNYHRLMLQSVLLADAARRHRGEVWPAVTREALARAAHWIFALLDPSSGSVPNLGANDGALILPLASSEFADFRPTVQAAARAFLRTSLPPGDWDEPSMWLGLAATAQTSDSTAYAAEHLRGPQSWAYLRAGAFKSRLGHMDQLHLDLWWRGMNVALDAGSFSYNAPPPWDNPLVSGLVHNTITVDGLDQMTRAGRFMVLDWFPAVSRPLLSIEPPVLAQMSAAHRGYEQRGVRVSRTVSLLERQEWHVRDSLAVLDRKPHVIRIHWLLADGAWRLSSRGPETLMRIRLPVGALAVAVGASGPLERPPEVTLIRAGRMLSGQGTARPSEGWVSPVYARKRPALSLALAFHTAGSLVINTRFGLSA